MSPDAYPIRDQTLVESSPTIPGKPCSKAEPTPGEGPEIDDRDDHPCTPSPVPTRGPDPPPAADPGTETLFTSVFAPTSQLGPMVPHRRVRLRPTQAHDAGLPGSPPTPGWYAAPPERRFGRRPTPVLGVLQRCTVHRQIPAKNHRSRLDSSHGQDICGVPTASAPTGT